MHGPGGASEPGLRGDFSCLFRRMFSGTRFGESCGPLPVMGERPGYWSCEAERRSAIAPPSPPPPVIAGAATVHTCVSCSLPDRSNPPSGAMGCGPILDPPPPPTIGTITQWRKGNRRSHARDGMHANMHAKGACGTGSRRQEDEQAGVVAGKKSAMGSGVTAPGQGPRLHEHARSARGRGFKSGRREFLF